MSCNIYFDQQSIMERMKEFGSPEYAGDCFLIVVKILNLDCSKDFTEILKQINVEMNFSRKTDMLRLKTDTPQSQNQRMGRVARQMNCTFLSINHIPYSSTVLP
ncbi:hypothetical protein ACYSNX_09215 [Myroides sp. LJL115]